MLLPKTLTYPEVATRADLLAAGAKPRQLTDAVKTGRLLRPRRDRYLPVDAPYDVIAAVRAGGRLSCTSALAAAGIWVHDASSVHVHLQADASRVRNPTSPRPVVKGSTSRDFTLHWRALVADEDSNSAAIGIVDSMIQAVLCQPPDFAVASLDSAMRFGLLTESQLDVVFFHLPKRLQHLRGLIDPRSESLLESLFRLQLGRAKIAFEVQVLFPGIGRVDFVVSGRIVIETDGAAFHGEKTAGRDYDRDLKLTALGYLVLRLNYRQVVFEPDIVMSAVRAAQKAHRPVKRGAADRPTGGAPRS